MCESRFLQRQCWLSTTVDVTVGAVADDAGRPHGGQVGRVEAKLRVADLRYLLPGAGSPQRPPPEGRTISFEASARS